MIFFFFLDKMQLYRDEFEISFVQRKSYMCESLFVTLRFVCQIVFLGNMENIIGY